MPSSKILPIHRMTDIESQGDEADYGNKQYVSMVETINSQTINEQKLQKSQKHCSYITATGINLQ